MKNKILLISLMLLISACDYDYEFYSVLSTSGNMQMKATYLDQELTMECLRSDSEVCYYTVLEMDCKTSGLFVVKVETCSKPVFHQLESAVGEQVTIIVTGVHWYYCGNDVSYPDQAKCQRTRDNRSSNGGTVID